MEQGAFAFDSNGCPMLVRRQKAENMPKILAETEADVDGKTVYKPCLHKSVDPDAKDGSKPSYRASSMKQAKSNYTSSR